MAEQLPRCFGEHEAGHPDCARCGVEDDCEQDTEALEQERSRRSSGRGRFHSRGRPRTTRSSTTPRTTGSSSRREADREDYPETEADVGFLGALAHNSVLAAFTVMARELWYSLTEIPRLKYRSPWIYDDDEEG